MGSIGPYTVIDPIGRGVSSTVYVARNTDTDEVVCIKVIPKAEKEKCFLDTEIKVLPTLNHPNIVKFIDFLEDLENYYLIEEYCNGETLTQFVESGKLLTERSILSIMQQLFSALMYIHAKGVSHRDLKPDNIIIIDSSNIKVIDFGLSTDDNSSLRSTFCGSVAFASPECINHQKYDAKAADIWSCGVICFYLSTGQIPWKGNNIVQLMRSISAVNYYIPNSILIPIKSIITQCLCLDPSKRPTAEKLLESPFLCTKGRRNARLIRVELSCGQIPRLSVIQPPVVARKAPRKRPKIYSV
ncbi:CAMK family protein kinase [Trichomonas vaginalis G3]|uniref:CAMK family protein kinase n=1 Tax=Trichomonas vaginalis (strain ATCC PRA-98 / G3) TaxID=412133 RepID=A2FTS4_TRIV3|nr:protein serine/threonine kinase protein [Trichomonas vaginalis G3]EAX91681.1 CAMK family protein kinase [Trichomonas vaginalis G3]KAI5541973.1 protein serine/threonine kinase protein [Trichomonas vaginalis G3]|eukprot:XP_001304611.1 CAMK family protein kinase [Trichomonas vaginalis G3]